MKYILKYSSQFKKDFKLIKKQKLDTKELEIVLALLENGIKLPPKYKEHVLIGKYAQCHECHIKPDWLLIWKYYDDVLVISLLRTGTHARILKKINLIKPSLTAWFLFI